MDYEIKDNNVLLGHIEWQRMRDTIYDFFNNENTMPDDLLLFYYSGHGIYDDGDLYLATSEMDPYIPSRRGFNFNELRRLMNDSISTSIVTILDCCSSGSANISKGHEIDAARLARSAIEGTSFQGEGRCILAASQEQGEAFALEENNHSVFTYYLLQALKGKIQGAFDSFGHLTTDSLSKCVYYAMMSLPPSKRPKQKPVRKVEGSGDIVLAYYPSFSRKEQEPKSSSIDEAAINKGKEYFDKGEFTRALDFYTELTNTYPTNPIVWNERGRALGSLNRYEEAISCFSVSIAIDPKNSQSWFGKGQHLHNLQRYEDSIECFEKGLLLDPQNANIWYGKGMYLQKKGRDSEALECFDRAIGLNPKAELAYYSKGALLRDLGMNEEALECFDKSSEIDPDLSLPWNDKGVLLRKKGKYEEAIECFNRAIKCFHKRPFVFGLDEIWSNKGSSLFYLGKYEEAIECFNKAIELDRTNLKFLNNKASALSSLQRDNEALKYFNKVIERDSSNSYAWSNKASILNSLGKVNEALKCCNKSIEINPNETLAWITKSAVLTRLQRRQEAIECCNIAIEKVTQTYPAQYTQKIFVEKCIRWQQ